MNHMKRTATLGVALVLGLTACSSGGTTDKGEKRSREKLAAAAPQYNAQPRENLKDGGTFTTAATVPDQFNAFHSDSTAGGWEISEWYNPTLFLQAANGEWSPNPDYLTDVKNELVDGNRRVTYTINPKARFNDGTPIDWRAFEARWKTANGKNKEFSVGGTDGYDLIESVKPGKNDRQAVVTYKGPWVWWQDQFVKPLHPAAADPETFNTGFLENPHNEWGAGPYHIKSVDHNAGTVVLERNPKWWGEPGKLDQRVFRTLEPTAELNAFRNGELDAIKAPSKEFYTQVKGMKDVEIRQSAILSTSFLTLNPDSKVLQDERVREAVLRGFDRETLLKVKFDGLNYTEKLPGSMSRYPFQDGYRDNLAKVGITYDEAKANELLDAAGWKKGPDGFRAKDGQKLRLVWPVTGDDTGKKNMATAAQAMMKKIGVEVSIDQRAGTELSKTLSEKTYDAFNLSWNSGRPDYGFAEFCGLFCTDPWMDSATQKKMIEKAREINLIADKAQQVERWNDLEVEAFRTKLMLPMHNGPAIWAVKKGLANFGASQFLIGPKQDIGWQK
ncbi:ABC transporter family substrate-binding protein [Streptomyces rubiginosohelvolus]|uniref:ABC transporter family substrate-binding protein n=1 Tax=Streptomyces rubiginosohelvolus TaxID=67362 RepID=UPI00371B2508